MSFMGQELGISRTYGFNHYETNFGKQVAHFKRYNSMQPIWDNNDFGLDQLYKAYASIGKARLASPALRSSRRYFLNEITTDSAHAKIHAVAKWENASPTPDTADVVLAFVNLDKDNQQSGTFDLSPGGSDSILGISRDRIYNVSNLSAFEESRRTDFLWNDPRTGQDLLDNGIFVLLNPVPSSDQAWSTAPFEAQFLKLHDLTTPKLEVNASEGGGASGSGTYAYDTDAVVHATPETGYSFVRWEGVGVADPDLAQTTVSMSRHRIVKAVFARKTHLLTLQANSGGLVSGDGNYTYGASAAIQATPDQNHSFVHWTGAGVADSTLPSTSVAMTSDRNVSAVVAILSRSLVVNVNGNGSATGSGGYDHGSVVNLTATPQVGHRFVNWSGSPVADASSATTTVTLSADTNLTANFLPIAYQLTVNANGSGSVTGTGAYDYGELAAVGATADNGFYFTGWTGEGIVDANSSSTSVSVTENRSVTAHFAAIPANQFVLQTFADPAEGLHRRRWNIRRRDGGRNPSHPRSRQSFSGLDRLGWHPFPTLSQESASVTLDQGSNANANAHFTPLISRIGLAASSGGSVSGEGNFTSGQTTSITATPDGNHTFSSWETGGVLTFPVTVSSRQYDASLNAYQVGGRERPPLVLARGHEYSFALDAPAPVAIPFTSARTRRGGGSAYLDEYLTGVTGSRSTQGVVTLTVDENTPGTLYYHCGVHAGMGNRITIVDAGRCWPTQTPPRP